jgi:hypothetical protein
VSENAQDIARSRCVTAFALIQSLVDQLAEGWPLGEQLLADVDSDREVVISEGDEALRAIDAFAQMFGIDVEART